MTARRKPLVPYAGQDPGEMRPRKAPDLREFRLHCVIADLLRVKAHRNLIWFHPANGENRTAITGAKLKRMGVQPGTPDLTFTLPDGRSAYMEIKPPGGKLSDSQEDFQARCERIGVPYAVVHSSQEAEQHLWDWGALRGPAPQARAA